MDPKIENRFRAIEQTIDEIVSRLEKLEAAQEEESRDQEEAEEDESDAQNTELRFTAFRPAATRGRKRRR